MSPGSAWVFQRKGVHTIPATRANDIPYQQESVEKQSLPFLSQMRFSVKGHSSSRKGIHSLSLDVRKQSTPPPHRPKHYSPVLYKIPPTVVMFPPTSIFSDHNSPDPEYLFPSPRYLSSQCLANQHQGKSSTRAQNVDGPSGA